MVTKGGNDFPEGENTDLTPRIVSAYRRANLVWLVSAIAAFVVAIVFAVMARVGDTAISQASTAGLENEVARIAAAIDTSARAAQLKADAIAMTPMLRAAILTDAATIADVVATEVRFKASPGEMLEFFQIQDKTATSLLKIPATAAIEPLFGRATRLDHLGPAGLNAVAGAPIVPNAANSQLTGQIVLSIPVDLGEARRQLATVSAEAILFGVGEPVVLVAKNGTGRTPITLPVETNPEWKIEGLKLRVTPLELVSGAGWIDPASYIAAGLASLLLLIFVIGRRR